MNILINATCSVGGGIQVCDSLIRTFADFPRHFFIVCASPQVRSSLESNYRIPSNVMMIDSVRPSLIYRFFGRDHIRDSLVEQYKIDVVFTILGPSYWRPAIPHLCGFAIPHYVYPESEFLKRKSLPGKIRVFLLKSIQMFSFRKHADALVTENPEVTQRLIQMYGCKRVDTVYNTYNTVFENPDLWDNACRLPAFDGTTLLTIASRYPHKNLEIIPAVAHILKCKYPDFKFRFVLSIQKEQLRSSIIGLEEHILFLGKVSISQCPFLYRQAQIMFLPTLLECFSAAWAEAMFMQIPILTSDLPFAHGICENGAMYVNPYSAEEIADSIFKLASSKEIQSSLVHNANMVRQKFSNSKDRMTQYLRILEEIKEDR